MKRIRRVYFDHDAAYLTLAGAKGVTVVDTEDVGLLRGTNWCLTKKGYAWGGRNGRQVLMARFLLNAPTDKVVDHIDRDPLNNRRANLRLCTAAENSRNSSGRGRYLKGAKYDRGRWQARISAGGVTRHLGCYATEAEAHAAYCRAARELHGDYACTAIRSKRKIPL